MNKIRICETFVSLQLGTHENNYFVCYGIIWGNIAYSQIDTKKTYIYNNEDLVCVMCSENIIHELPLTIF